MNKIDFPFSCSSGILTSARKYLPQTCGLILLSLAGCSQPLDSGDRRAEMPGADDANHPAMLRETSQSAQNDTGTMHGMFSRLMTFPETEEK